MRLCLLLGLIGVAACTRVNSEYCSEEQRCANGAMCNMTTHECMEVDAAPDYDAARCSSNAMCTTDNARFCSDEGECVGCADRDQMSDECAGLDEGTDYCTTDGECAECLANAQCTTADQPTCDATDFQCRPCNENPDCAGALGGEKCSLGRCVECATHSDCASEVCDPTSNTCVAEGDILYVGGTSATNQSTCGTAVLPCASINYGLGRINAQSYMSIRPESFLENVSVDQMDLTMVGPGATIVSAANDTPVLEVRGGSHFTIDGIILRSAIQSSSGPADGIRCLDSNTELTVLNAEIHNNDRRGISAGSCTVTVRGAYIHDNGDLGVFLGVFDQGGELTITGSIIARNDNGGVVLQGAGFRLINNFVIDNGGVGAYAGGIRIENGVEIIPLQELLFNTVAGNESGSNEPASGVVCSVAGASNPTILGNIVYANISGDNQTSGSNCAWEYSNIEDVPAAGTNISAPPMFVGANIGNYHIRAMSPCIDQVMTSTSVEFDADGQRRDDLPDIGADEIVP